MKCKKYIWSISCRQPRIFLDCKLGRQQSSPHQLGGHRRLSSHWLGLLSPSQVASSYWLIFSSVPVRMTILDLFSKSFVLWRHMTRVLSTEYTECQAFWPAVRIGSPLTRKRVLLPCFGPKGEIFWACGGGGGGTQFRRRDRHSGILCILLSLYGTSIYCLIMHPPPPLPQTCLSRGCMRVFYQQAS